MNQWSWRTPGKHGSVSQLSREYMDSQRLKWHASLHNLLCMLAWYLWGIPNYRNGCVFGSFTCCWDSFLFIGLPCSALVWRVLPSLIVFNFVVFGCCIFSEGRMKRSVSRGKGGWKDLGKWKEEKLWLGCIIWEKGLFSIKRCSIIQMEFVSCHLWQWNECGWHYVKWNKPGIERQWLNSLIHLWIWKMNLL